MSKVQFDSPLSWPPGKPESKVYLDNPFKVTPGEAIESLYKAVGSFGVTSARITADWDLGSRDNWPLAKQRAGRNPGVAVVIERKGQSFTLACDQYREHWMNCRALYIAIEGFRSMLRYLGEDFMQQSLQGHLALPPAGPLKLNDAPRPSEWYRVLQVSESTNLEEITAAWKALLERHHPDKPGGNAEYSQLINAAYQQAKRAKSAKPPGKET